MFAELNLGGIKKNREREKKAEYFANNGPLLASLGKPLLLGLFKNINFFSNLFFLRNNSTFAHKYYLFVGTSFDLIKY